MVAFPIFFLCDTSARVLTWYASVELCRVGHAHRQHLLREVAQRKAHSSSCTDCAKQVLGDERHGTGHVLMVWQGRAVALEGVPRPQPRRQSGQLFASTLLLPATARSVFVETGMGSLSYRRVCTVRPMYSGGGRFTQPARRPERRASGADHTSPEATRRVVAAPGRGRRASRLRRPTRVP